MKKSLSEMSLEELWQLFPIVLETHKVEWALWYMEEEALLRRVLPMDQIRGICHIGSTSVEAIYAKPIIDILVLMEAKSDRPEICNRIVEGGYRFMYEEGTRIAFNKGYTEDGFAERVFHLHLREAGDLDELYFRDFLREHRDIAEKYESMKKELSVTYRYNRDAYTDAKTEFIRKYTEMAKIEYRGRYDGSLNG